jgi:hypothetical protein
MENDDLFADAFHQRHQLFMDLIEAVALQIGDIPQ